MYLEVKISLQSIFFLPPFLPLPLSQMENPSFLYLFSKGLIFILLGLVMCHSSETYYGLYLFP